MKGICFWKYKIVTAALIGHLSSDSMFAWTPSSVEILFTQLSDWDSLPCKHFFKQNEILHSRHMGTTTNCRCEQTFYYKRSIASSMTRQFHRSCTFSHSTESGLFDLFQKLHEKLYHQPNTLNNCELSPEVASNFMKKLWECSQAETHYEIVVLCLKAKTHIPFDMSATIEREQLLILKPILHPCTQCKMIL